jgi:hypothetical protein
MSAGSGRVNHGSIAESMRDRMLSNAPLYSSSFDPPVKMLAMKLLLDQSPPPSPSAPGRVTLVLVLLELIS